MYHRHFIYLVPHKVGKKNVKQLHISLHILYPVDSASLMDIQKRKMVRSPACTSEFKRNLWWKLWNKCYNHAVAYCTVAAIPTALPMGIDDRQAAGHKIQAVTHTAWESRVCVLSNWLTRCADQENTHSIFNFKNFNCDGSHLDRLSIFLKIFAPQSTKVLLWLYNYLKLSNCLVYCWS